MAIQFRLRELMAEYTRKTGQPCTYETIHKAKQISPNTLSKVARNKIEMVGVSVLDRLCEFFDCEPGDLIVRVRE
jgi:putative transcriptional regulator